MNSILSCCLYLSLLCLAAQAAPVDDAVSYAGYRVVRVIPATGDELAALRTILDDHAAADVWLAPSQPGSPVDVNASPLVYPTFITALKSRELSHAVMIDDVQWQIDLEADGIHEARRQLETKKPGNIVGSYVAYADMLTWLTNLASTNGKVTVQSYGRSLENRPLTVVKISKSTTTSTSTTKPVVVIEAGMHGREWISPATAVWIINQLATSTDPDVNAALTAADWLVVPVANPDGYEYTQKSDRLWRKNRAVNWGSDCRGVDLNRNWNSHWMETTSAVGGSSDPCAETYAGRSAFSEPESKALSDAIMAIKSRVKAFISLHAYSQIWMTPWGYTTSRAPDNDALMNVANKGARALQAVSGTTYRVGSPAVMLYAAAGGSFDWAKEKAGIQYSYALELRDTGRYGFLLPADQIVPTGTETWAGITTAVKSILNL